MNARANRPEPTGAPEPSRSARNKEAWKWVGLAVLAVMLVVAASHFNLRELLQEIFNWIGGLGPWGPILFMALFVVATVVFVPGSLFTLSAGVLFGVFQGTLYISMASVVAAAVAFSISRYLARDWVVRKMERHPRFKAIDEAVAAEGWKIVGLMRLSPIFPFNFLNCLFGITKVSMRDFLLASWLGALPGTMMYAYIGSLAGSLANLGHGTRQRTPMEWALYGIGFLAVIVVTVWVTRLAKRALNQKIST